ncbi:MAG: YigZ family protein, partial [Gammaproteobacteria bacterium]|nr:YigZ family protein [Gammaproteobacteria bacterium]
MRTLTAPCRFEETIKHSRFIAHAAPVSSQADTLAFFETVADPGATHNCWAWRVDGVHRFNDDGEPAGTAGRPILSVLEGRRLDRLMVVVTRHYGGIKLGVGGLARAYSGCAAKCLDGAELAEIQKRLAFNLAADYAWADVIHRLLAEYGARKLGESPAGDGLGLRVEIGESRFEPLC